jgi:hypothetical protein
MSSSSGSCSPKKKRLLGPEDEDTVVIQNVLNILPSNTVFVQEDLNPQPCRCEKLICHITWGYAKKDG